MSEHQAADYDARRSIRPPTSALTRDYSRARHKTYNVTYIPSPRRPTACHRSDAPGPSRSRVEVSGGGVGKIRDRAALACPDNNGRQKPRSISDFFAHNHRAKKHASRSADQVDHLRRGMVGVAAGRVANYDSQDRCNRFLVRTTNFDFFASGASSTCPVGAGRSVETAADLPRFPQFIKGK